jgi:spore coat protein U-like protein
MQKSITRLLTIGCALGAIGLLAAGQARAGTTGGMSVSANVAGSCSISTSPMQFGAITPSGGNTPGGVDATGMVTLECTPGTNATNLKVVEGANDLHSDRNNYQFALTDGAHYISYGLDVYGPDGSFQIGNTAVPADNVGGFNNVIDAGPLTGAEVSGGETYNIYGQVEPGVPVYANAFSDTLEISVTY